MYMEINGKRFKICVKAGAKENSIAGYDDLKGCYRVNIKARAKEGEANLELVKFLSRKLKKRVSIVSGFRSKEKLVEVL